jgi:thiosulfate/3-mercaptopyruvate sulfurtransferase
MRHYDQLVSIHTLAEHLRDPNWVIIDCRFGLRNPNEGLARYRADHIPGARYAHLDNDLSSPVTAQTGRHPLPDANQLAEKFGQWGIDKETQIVVYDDMGGAFAGRLWWLARWMGHRNVALLDGGYPTWIAEDLPVTAEIVSPVAKRFTANPDRTMWLSTEEVVGGLAQRSILLLDARAPERFRGEVEPLDSVAGHVPGAINRPFQANLTTTRLFLSPEVLYPAFLQVIGSIDPKNVVHMCGSGVTACHNILAMEIAGLAHAKLYVGSWSEWIRDPVRGVAKGV